ncbi:hypothetical protein EYF80_026263 [Liparis tanakae]|uniref:Uncharacterized protein n=1 Tax=Liparis tanakae TaxID=230148 RepID=A0A4Z2HD10_9TELE|nr:hypothetical protein EYF80_026263 [Liparis tanakae]
MQAAYQHSHPWQVVAVLDVMLIQDIDFGGGVVRSQTAPDRQRQSDVEALFSLVQRVVDNHDPTVLLPLTLVETKDADMLLWTGDVVRVRQNDHHELLADVSTAVYRDEELANVFLHGVDLLRF